MAQAVALDRVAASDSWAPDSKRLIGPPASASKGGSAWPNRLGSVRPVLDTQNTNGCDPSDYQPQKCPIDASGSPIAVRGGDEVGRPHTYFYHPDHLGSTSWVTDEAGRVREHVLYFPYGSVWRDAKNDAEGSPPRTQALLFTGKEYDQETGYYYFGARYYDPQVARWLSVDPMPIGEETDGFRLSLYAYVRWSPLTLLDPDGLGDEDAGVKEVEHARGYLARNAKQALKQTAHGAETTCDVSGACGAAEGAFGTTFFTQKKLTTKERATRVVLFVAGFGLAKLHLGSLKKGMKAGKWLRKLGRWLKFWKRGKRADTALGAC